MQSYALIGHPLGHSFSPQIHARLFALEGIDARYDLTDIAPENLAAQMPLLCRRLRAFNVTIPHKRAVIPLIDSLTENARLYGACLLYTSPSPRDRQKSRMPSSA